MPRPSTLLLSLCLALPALAQTPPCDALNDINNSVGGAITAYGFAGPGVRGWQHTPGATLVVFGVRLFTGNTGLTGDRYMTVEIWDDAGGLPGTRLAGGTWKIAAGLGDSWQGANLDLPVTMIQNTPYWIVWREPGFSTIPVEPSANTLPSATLSGTVWTLGPVGALKFRLFCFYLDDVGVLQNGGPCPGATGRFGTLFTNQVPQVGNQDFQLEASGFPSNALSLLVLGILPNWPSVPIPGLPAGCLLHNDDAGIAIGFTGTSNERGPTAAGHVPFPLPLPPNASLTGAYLAAQVASLDAGLAAPLPFAVSNGLRITLQ